MNNVIKNTLAAAGFTLWGAAGGYSGVKFVQMLKEDENKAKEIAAIYQPKIDSIKANVKNEVSEKSFKYLQRQLDRPSPSAERYAKWEHILDSLEVSKLGKKAIEEFKNKAAEVNYKKALQAVSDTIKNAK